MNDLDLYELEVLRSESNNIEDLSFSDDTLICECNCVSYGDIKNYIGKNTDFEFLAKEYQLGTACKSCIKLIESMK